MNKANVILVIAVEADDQVRCWVAKWRVELPILPLQNTVRGQFNELTALL